MDRRRGQEQLRAPATGLILAVLALAAPGTAHARQTAEAGLPTVELPAELDRVLRDYERAWQARDADGLAALFTEDGFVLRPGYPPVRGREAIRAAYATSGGPLTLVAYAWDADGDLGHIIGGYGAFADMPPGGKFVLTLRRVEGRWLIVSDMDNGN